MKVLIIHNAYQQYGGEDAVVRLESELLIKNGDLVKLHIVSNDKIGGLWAKIITSIGVIFSWPAYQTTRKLIKAFSPDVVHVHNFFPLLSPAVFYACKKANVPVVLTLHNYRLFCPTALLMFKGKVTEKSLRAGPWWALRHRVYRESLVGTLLLCLMIDVHNRIGTWKSVVDRFIVLTDFARTKFSIAGLPSERLIVKPNFVDSPSLVDDIRDGFLFVGRISEEKGIDILLSASALLPRGQEAKSIFRIAGDGPLAASVQANSCVCYLGKLNGEQVSIQMRKSQALLLPSVWYEGFPMVLVEAYANGLPVIASRIGALAELVEDGVTGLLFDPANPIELAEKILWAQQHPWELEQMGRAARQRYEERYTPDFNYLQLTAIYRETIDHHQTRRI